MFTVGDFEVLRCRRCTGGFVSPLPERSEIPAIYDDRYGDGYLDGVMHGEAFVRERYGLVESALGDVLPELVGRPVRRALDVGCGSGRFLACLREGGWQTVGVEISPRLAVFARDRLALDVLQVEFLDVAPGRPFDLVTMFHIVEHFIDPIAALRHARSLLRPGGALFVETPNWESIGARLRGPRWSHFIPPEHVVFLGPRSIRRLAESSGFSTLLCRTTVPPIVESVSRLPRLLRPVAAATYRLAASAGYGPALQYIGVRD
jgi:SAM-dependent methyltransferase